MHYIYQKNGASVVALTGKQLVEDWYNLPDEFSTLAKQGSIVFTPNSRFVSVHNKGVHDTIYNNDWLVVWPEGHKIVLHDTFVREYNKTQNFNLDMTPKTEDSVNHPAHYTDGQIEVADFIADKNLDFFLGNVVKYVCRAGKKDPAKLLEDLKKAQWYLNYKISQIERTIHVPTQE
jgi:hypothetical protein